MKKIKYKKILVAILWIFTVVSLGSSLSFASLKEKELVSTSLNITIYNNKNTFLNKTNIINFLNERNDLIIGVKFKDINIQEIEKALNSHPAIQNAEVSKSINGEIKIEVIQRTPILRIFNKDGESYYIDSENKLMPLNENYSARVILASGEIFEPFSKYSETSITEIKKNKSLKEISVLDDIVDVTNYINKDSILSQFIQQIYVNTEKELMLYPSIGNHKIIFGNSENIAEKFNKLKLFYREGLNKSDSWTKYSTINLKYKNLVVCTKK